MKTRTITFDTILRTIADDFRAIDQWAGDRDYSRAHEYAARAEALIELVEVQVCGSIGGFDSGQQTYQPPANRYTHVSDRLWNRYSWLITKYW